MATYSYTIRNKKDGTPWWKVWTGFGIGVISEKRSDAQPTAFDYWKSYAFLLFISVLGVKWVWFGLCSLVGLVH